jgi:hypothetical protein
MTQCSLTGQSAFPTSFSQAATTTSYSSSRDKTFAANALGESRVSGVDGDDYRTLDTCLRGVDSEQP